MRRNNNTGQVSARPRREPSDHEPLRQWSNLPITEERAKELVDVLTYREDSNDADALLELICGLMPAPLYDDQQDLDKRYTAGSAALVHAFALTSRVANELAAYVVNLKCARWE